MSRPRQAMRLIATGAFLLGLLALPAVTSELKIGDFADDRDKLSYTLGAQFVKDFIKKQAIDVNVDYLVHGIRDALSGGDLVLSAYTRTQILLELAEVTKAREAAKKAQKEADAAAFANADHSWKTKLKKPDLMTFDKGKDYFWILETNKGKITVKLMPDVAPMHATSTIFLTKKGFYDLLTFHRVITGFMAQGGCPLGTGTGGPGYKYDGEFSPNVKHDRPYLLSMANSGPGTDGSQFFLTFKPTPWLDSKHTIFGEVVEGQDVVKKLEAAAGPPPKNKPTESLYIKKATIEEKAK